MSFIKFPVLPALLFLMVLSGCKDEAKNLYDNHRIWNCHYEGNIDSSSIRNAILGVWEWKYVKCCPLASRIEENGTEAKGLQIEFRNDGSGVVDNGSDEPEEFQWEIKLEDNDLYGFKTTPYVSRIDGRLLFCEDIMLCNSSYLDGADNFWRKR